MLHPKQLGPSYLVNKPIFKGIHIVRVHQMSNTHWAVIEQSLAAHWMFSGFSLSSNESSNFSDAILELNSTKLLDWSASENETGKFVMTNRGIPLVKVL